MTTEVEKQTLGRLENLELTNRAALVDHPAHMVEGWMVLRAKELGIQDDDLAKLVEILEEAEVIAGGHAELLEKLRGTALLEAAPEEVRAAAEALTGYLEDLGGRVDKAGKKLAGSRVKRLRDVHRVLTDLLKEVDEESNDKEGSMSEFDKSALDDVAKAAFDALEAKVAEAEAAAETAATEKAAAEAKAAEATAEAERLAAEKAEFEKAVAEATKEEQPNPEEEILKSLPEAVQKMLNEREERIAKAEARLEAAERVAKAERDARLDGEFVAKAAAWEGLSVKAEDFGPKLRELSEKAPDLAAEVERILTGASEAVKAAGTLEEKGKSGDAPAGPMDRLEALAKSIAKAKNVSEAVAFDEAMQTDEGRKLYNEYLNTKMEV